MTIVDFLTDTHIIAVNVYKVDAGFQLARVYLISASLSHTMVGFVTCLVNFFLSRWSCEAITFHNLLAWCRIRTISFRNHKAVCRIRTVYRSHNHCYRNHNNNLANFVTKLENLHMTTKSWICHLHKIIQKVRKFYAIPSIFCSSHSFCWLLLITMKRSLARWKVTWKVIWLFAIS